MTLSISASGDGVTWSGGADSNIVGPFQVLGGRYLLVTSSEGGTASATLEAQSPDANYVAVGTAVTTSETFDLPPGWYQIALGAAANVSAGFLSRVPYRQ